MTLVRRLRLLPFTLTVLLALVVFAHARLRHLSGGNPFELSVRVLSATGEPLEGVTVATVRTPPGMTMDEVLAAELDEARSLLQSPGYAFMRQHNTYWVYAAVTDSDGRATVASSVYVVAHSIAGTVIHTSQESPESLVILPRGGSRTVVRLEPVEAPEHQDLLSKGPRIELGTITIAEP